MDGAASGAERAMGRFLLDGEEMVVAVHQHWTRVIGVVTATLVGLVLVVLIGLVTPTSAGIVSDLSLYLWLLLLGYCLVQLLLWRHDWFVATDRRLLLTYGLVSRKVAMMPLAKVTDMSFNQSFVGRMLGYGTYVMESAGQDQALRQIDHIPDAEQHYRSICAEIFGEGDTDNEDSNDAWHRHQERTAVDDETDPFGIPVQRHRVVRAATVLAEDREPSWSVSREDVPPAQQVSPRRDPHADDDRS